jgi:transcriptional regulator with XRE-family HTH domain
VNTIRARAPFHHQLRAAVTERGLTLESLQRRLGEVGHPVARSTLSYWQNGHRRPRTAESMLVVDALEDILQVPAGWLRDALEEPPEQALRPNHLDFVRVGPPLERLLAQIDCVDALRSIEALSYVDLASFGPSGNCHRTHSLYVLRALADCHHYALVYGGDPGSDVELMTAEALGGCRIGRVRRDPVAQVMVAELVLDRHLRRGETHLVQFAVHDENERPSMFFTKVLPNPKAMIASELTFHPHRLPVHLEEYERASEDGPDLLVRSRTLGFDRRVSLIRERARRGLVGLRWSYA